MLKNLPSRRLRTLFLCLIVFVFGSGQALATDFFVTNLTDNGGVNPAVSAGTGTMRQAIIDMNAAGVGPHNIYLNEVFGTITMEADWPAIAQSVTITGPGAPFLTINGADTYKIFEVQAAGIDLAVNDLTITNGIGTLIGGVRIGGGICYSNSGASTLAVNRVHFTSNGVAGENASGGAIGILNGQATATIIGCAFDANSASGGTNNNHGGALFVNSTLSAVMTVTNSTMTGNASTFDGGAIYVGGSGGQVNINHCTVYDNNSVSGGAVHLDASGTFNFENSIIHSNSGGVDLDASAGGSATSNEVNVAGNVNGAITGTPLAGTGLTFGTYGNTGGMVPTVRLTGTTTSIIDGATGSTTTHDARGFLRTGVGAAEDLGAYEDAAVRSNTSDIIETAAFTYPTSMNPETFDATNIDNGLDDEVEIAQFTIRDNAGAPDNDILPTVVSGITVNFTNTTNNLARAALYIGTNEFAEEAVSGASVTFNLGSAVLIVPDDGTLDIRVLVSFATGGLVGDGDVIDVSISNSNITTSANGSDHTAFALAQTSETGAENQINVVATTLAFSGVPASVNANTDFGLTVSARDGNGNLDLGNTSTVSLAQNGGGSNLSSSGGLSQALATGTYSWSDLEWSAGGSFQIDADDGAGLTDVTSSSITVAAPTTLTAGDITFTMINTTAPQEFAFMLMQPIVAGTEIFFTDEGLDNADNFPGSAEGIIRFVATEAHAAGAQILIDPSGLSAVNSPAGTATGAVTHPNPGFSLSQEDQLIAFQGDLDGAGAILTITSFPGAISTASSGWVTTTTGANDSALPSTLTNGTTANSIDLLGAGHNNAVYNFSEVNGYLPNLQAYINTPANWSTQSAVYANANITAYGTNNAPTITSFTGYTGANTLRTLEANVFGFTDGDGVDTQLASIQITGLGNINTFGTLFNDLDGDKVYDGPGEDVSVNDIFTYAQLENDELILLLGSSTGGPANFNYTVSDGGLSSVPGSFTGFIIDNSLHFAGTDDYVSVPYKASMNAFDMTVEGWFYLDNVSGARFLVGRSGGAAQNGDYKLTVQAGVPRFSVYGTVWTDVDATSTLAVSNWNHIVGIKDGTDLKIYVNGILENTVTGQGISASSTNELYLGAESVSPPAVSDLFIGQMDEVRIWNHARGAKEIRSSAAASSNLSLVDASLIAYYTFDTGDAGNANNTPGSEENRLEDFSLNQNSGNLSYTPGFALTGGTSNWISSTLPTHVAALTPEINVLVNGVDYADGGAAYDFGTVATGGPFQDVTITIENVGLSTTDLTGLVPASVAVSNATDFSIQTAPTLTTLSAGDTDEFVVRFLPSTTGALNSTLNNTLVSSDADENPYNISFTGMGSGSASEIDVQGGAVSIPSGAGIDDANTTDNTDFGSVGYGSGNSITKIFTVTSTGSIDLDVDDIQITGSSNFTLDLATDAWTFPNQIITAPAGTKTFRVVYLSAATEIEESATVTITNDDPNENPYTFVVKARSGDHALAFQASQQDNKVVISNNINLVPTSASAKTYEAWIKPNAVASGTIFASYENGATANSNFMLELSASKLRVVGDGTDNFLSVSDISTTEWTHIAVVYANGANNTKLYINGNLDAEGTLTYNAGNGGTAIELGGRSGTPNPSDWYDGLMDEVRIYNGGLSLSVIRNNALTAGLTAGTGLLASYSFNVGEAEGVGGSTALPDIVGGTYNGSLGAVFDMTGANSNWVVSTANDTDVIAPAIVTGYPIASNNRPDGFDIEVQLTEPGTYHYTVNANGVAPANQAAITSGADSQSGQHGSVTVTTANSTVSVGISGLNVSTTYDVFLFAEDANGNTQVEITEIADVTTTAANNAPVISALDATAASPFVEDGPALIIDSDVTFSDTEFDGTNYDGSFISILRDGGSGNSDDVFGFSAFSTYTLVSNQIRNGATPIADFNTSTPGELYINFNQGQSVSQADVNGVLQHVTYSNSNNNPPASVLIDFTPNDGVSSGTEVSITINITSANDVPAMTVSSPVAFTEDAGAVNLDGTMTFSDPELAVGNDFDGSSVDIRRNGGANSNDEFSFVDNASFDLNTGQIRRLPAMTPIATWTHVAASGILTLAFDQNADVTNAEVNGVLQQIFYNNANNTPPTTITLDVTPNDGTAPGSAAAIIVNITAANDAPAIAVTSPGAFTEGAGAVTLDGTMAFNDPELILANDFDGASLTIVRNGGFSANDEFSFTGNASFDLNAGQIRRLPAMTPIATWTHVAASGTLTLAFDQTADPTTAEVNGVLQLIEYNNPNSTPPANVILDITPNDGTIPGSATQLTVNITATNNPPSLSVNTPVAFTEDLGAVILDGAMTFTDAELGGAADFDGAVITIARNGGANGDDVFTFNPAGGFTLPANDLLRGGATPVGTFIDNGSGTLTITFNQPATNVSQAEINTILQNIEYENTNNNPPANITLDLTPNDGADPGTVQQIVVNITATNDLPSMANLGPAGDSPFIEGGSAVIIDADVSFVDPELAVGDDYDGSVITIERNGAAVGDDVFAFVPFGAFTFDGVNLERSSVDVATFAYAAGTAVITLNVPAADITGAELNSILQHVSYSNSSGTPPANVTIDFTPNDGTGSGSAAGTTINIYNNDSDIDATATLAATLDYINHTGATVSVANSLKVGELRIRDGGGSDTDGAVTTLDAITLQFTNPGLIQEVALFDQAYGSILSSEVALTGGGSDEAVFTGLSGFTASDDGTFVFSVGVTFNNVSGINDNTDQIDFTVISATANAGGSQFAAADAGGASPAIGGNNAIAINATDIEITDFAGADDDLPLGGGNEVGISLNNGFTVSVAAVDANGNVDVDYSANVAVIAPTPDATFTGTNINGAALASGVHTWNDLTFSTVRTSVTFTVQEDANSYTDTPVFTFDVSEAQSDIVENTAFDYPENIDYRTYDATNINLASPGDELRIAEFIIQDGGAGHTDTDGKATRIYGIEFRITNHENLNQLAVYFDNAGDYERMELDVASNIVGSDLNFFWDFSTGVELEAPQGGSKTFYLYATFNQNTTIDDNDRIEFEVIGVDVSPSRSQFVDPVAAGGATTSNFLNAGDNEIEVTGDRLIFSANNPTSATFERGVDDLNFTVQAQDNIGNVDLDETSELLISSTGGAIFEIDGSIGTTFNLTAGEASPTIYGMSEEDLTTITVADNDGTTGSQGTATTLTTPATSTVASSVNIHDTTAPFVATPATDVEPDDNASMNPITNVLTMQFNEEVAGVATKNITLLSLTPSVHVISIGADDPGVTSDADGLVTITLPESPKGSRSYSVTVDDGAFDDSPNNNPAVNGGVFTYTSDYQGTTEWNFTTPVDATPPSVVVTRNPITKGDIDVATSDNSVSFDIAFNEEITPATFAESDILVTTSNDLAIGGDQTDQTADNFAVNDIILTPDGDNINWTLTITSIASPTVLSTINITIQTGANRMEDETGNDLALPVVSSNFIFDQTAPVHSVDILRTASSSPALTGVIDDLTATLSLSVDGNVYPVTNPGTGVWTLPATTISPALSAGTFNVIVTATDDAGNVSVDGTSNELTVDLTKPTIIAAYLFDHDNSGHLDEVTIEFSEDIQDASVELGDWTVGGATPDAIVPFGSIHASNSEDLGMANDQFITFDVSSSTLGTGLVPVIYTKSASTDIADIAGNENDSDAAIVEEDRADPVLVTAWQYDTDGDGNIDEIVVEMNEEVDETTAVAGNFTLGNNYKGDGSSVSGILLSNVNVNTLDANEADQYVTLDVSVVGTAAVAVDYNAGVLTDASGNSAATTTPITSDDQAAPVFVSATYYDTGTADGNIDEVLVEMSEPITDIVPGAEGDFSIAGATVAVAASIDNGVDGGTTDDQIFTFDVSGAGANGTAALVLAYNPAGSGDADLEDRGGNTLAALANAGVNAIDAAAPLVTNVTSSAANDSYRQGDLIEIQITFTENVAVTGGQPQLTLETGATDRDALYTSGTGTPTLTLGYTVQSGDDSGDLDYVGTGSFTAGTIVDASASANVAVRTLVAPAASGSLGFNKDIVIDNAAPTVDAITLNTVTNGDDASKTTNDNTVSFNVDFADDIDPSTISFNDFTVIVTGDITFDALEAADVVVFNAPTAVYTVSVTNVANDGTIKLRVSTDAQDLAGNFIATPTTSVGAFNIDNTPPQVTFTNPNASPTNSDPFNLTVNFDQSISGLLHTEFGVTNGATTGVTGTDPGAGPFTLTINPTDNQTGNVVVNLAANSVQDLAGNNNLLSANFNAGFDDQAPTITASTVVEGRDLTLTSQINEMGQVFWGVYADGATPTAAQVAAGTGALSSGSVIHNLAANNINENILLAADNTDYDLFLLSEDNLTPANQEAAPTLINIRSGGVQITAPVLTNICLEGAALVLGDIVITEDIITDFRSSGSPRTLKLELPVGFEFNTSAAGDGVSRLVGGDIVAAGLSLAYPSSNAVEVTYSVPTQNSSTLDRLTITGLEVLAVGSTDYSGVTITRTGGSGDIYLASEGDARTFGTLTSEPPFNAPQIVLTDPADGHPYIIEAGTNLAQGNTLGDAVASYTNDQLTGNFGTTSPFTIHALNAANTVTIYSDETLMTTVIGPQTGATSYAPTLTNLGLSASSIGITNFWITVTDGISCESAATKYSVAIVNASNSEGETTFTVDNTTGTTLTISEPIGYTGLFTGNGLTDFDYAVSGNTEASVRFVPNTAGQNSHIIEFLLSAADGVQARYTTTFTVNTTQTVLTSGQTKTFCNLSIANALAIEDPDPGADPNIPDFHEIQVWESNGGVPSNITAQVVAGPTPDADMSTPTSLLGWTYNPQGGTKAGVTVGDTLTFRMIVQNNATGLFTTYATEQVIIYAQPAVTNFDNGDGDGTFDRFYCANEGTFNITRDVTSDIGSAGGSIASGYTLTYMGADNAIGGSGLNADVVYDLTASGNLHNNFDPADPNRENVNPATQIGTYRISYTTPTLPAVAVGCSTTVTADIAVLAQPAIPTLSNDYTHHGGLVGPDYIVEYTEGNNVVPDPSATSGANLASERFNWYNDASLLSSLKLGVNSADNTLDLDASNAIPNTNGALTKDIFLTTDHFYDSLSLTETFLGCTSPVRKLSIQVHEVPDEVIVDHGASAAAYEYVIGNEYIYEYCVTDASTVATMDPITLINFLDNSEPNESYYVIYKSDMSRYDSLTSLTIADVTLDPIADFPLADFPGWEGKGGQSLTFFVSQRDHNNNYPVAAGEEYIGAESTVQRITVEVNIIPDAPDATQFTGGSASYQLCSGESLANIVLTNDSDPRFEWFREDSGNPGNPDLAIDGADGFAVKGFNGRFAEEGDLLGFTNVNNSVANRANNTAIVYHYYVRQYTDYNDFTSYQGCVSNFTEITITVYPDPAETNFTIGSNPTDLEINVCEGDLGGIAFTLQNSAVYVDPTVTYNWYEAIDNDPGAGVNLGLASPTPRFSGATATGFDLAISTTTVGSAPADTVYFMLSQENNGGVCETEFAEMAVLTINVFDIPAVPTILDDNIYYCEGGGVGFPSGPDPTAVGEVGATFTWYADTDVNLTGETVTHNAASVTEANLGMAAVNPTDTIFYVSQNQTDGLGALDLGLDGLTTFAGCTSPQLAVNIHKLRQYTAPVVVDASICDQDAIPTFAATGTETGALISWFDNTPTLRYEDDATFSTLFTPDGSDDDGNNTPLNLQGAIDRPEVGTNTMRVTQTTDLNIEPGFMGCTSPESTFDLEIRTLPTIPDVVGSAGNGLNDHDYCSTQDAVTTLDVQTPDATLTYKWYTSSTLSGASEILVANDESINPALHGSYPGAVVANTNTLLEFFVQTDTLGCLSSTRGGVGVGVRRVAFDFNPLPVIEIVDDGDVSLTDEFCYSENAADDPIFQANVTADVPAASGAWSINSTGTIYNDDPTNATLDLDGSYSNASIGRGDTDGGLPEVFQLTYTYTDGNGCTSSSVLGDGAVEQLTIDPLPFLSIFDNNEGVTFSGTPRYCAGDYNLTDVTNDTRDNIMNVLGEFGSNFSGAGSFSITGEDNNNVPLTTSANSASFSLSVLGDSIELVSVRSYNLTFAATGSKGCMNDVTQVIEVKARPEVTFNKISGGCENPAVAFEPLTIFDATSGVSGRNLPYAISSLNLTWEYYRSNADGSANTDDPYPTDLNDDFIADNDWIVNTTGGLYVIDADGDIRDFGDTNISETFLIDDPDAEGQTFAARVVAYTNDADQCLNDFANAQFATQQVDIEISPNPTFRWDGVSLGEPTTFYLRETRLAADKIDRVYMFWDRNVDFQDIIDFTEIANDSLAKTVNNTIAIPTTDLLGEANDVFVYETDPNSVNPNQNPFTVAKQYNVTIAFRTSNDCVTTLTKAVNIVPNIDVASQPNGRYHQTFGPDADGDGPGTAPFDLITSGWFPENLRDDVLSIADSAESIRPYSWTYGDLNNGSGNGLINNTTYTQVDGSDGFAWHTAALDQTGTGDTYNYLSSEDSWIYSPSFDITGMSRPMVKFTMIYNFGAGNEGAVLQHSTDGGVTWVPLGSFETNTGVTTGLDWFDFDNVQADPGQQTTKFGALTALGWAGGADDGKTVKWVSARHSLDDIRVYLENDLGLTDQSVITNRLSDVRFRFAIAATNLDDNDNFFGFALDDFTIQERTKNVMIEQFVSVSNDAGAEEVNDPTSALKTAIYDLLPGPSVTSRDEIVLAYHSDLGFADPFNTANPAGPSARSIYYNVDQVTSILDGQLGGNSSSAKSGDLTWNLTDLSLSSLKDPGFDITLTPDPTATDSEVKGTILFEANQAYPANTELRAYVAILEDTVVQTVGGIDGFGNVMRELLPAGSGEYIKLDSELAAGDPLPIGSDNLLYVQWDLANISDDAELSAIVFVQNSQTKEIYQSVKIPNANTFVAAKNTSTITDIGDDLISAQDFKMYPNPTDHEVFILFDRVILEDMEWSIFDQSGRIFDQGEISAGKEGFSLQTDRFPSGLYYMSVRGDKSKFDFKKLMITH